MNKIAQFHKVSFEQFKESWDDSFPGASEEEIKEIYDQIKLPKRATRGSAGYDFFSPVDFELKPGETIKIPTGIRVFIESDWVLNIFPRSGLGFKFRLQMNNTVGIIDSDYEDRDKYIEAMNHSKLANPIETIVNLANQLASRKKKR